MRSIRGGSGFGDSIYLQSVARHFVQRGERLEVCSNFPDIFRPLGDKVTLSPFRKTRVDILAHYSERRRITATDQFQDCCVAAGIREPVDQRIDWTLANEALAEECQRAGKPVIVVQMPRAPFGRADGFGMEFLPDCRVIQMAIDAIGDRATFVQVGKGEALFRFRGIDLDLTNRTTVADVLDVSSIADGFLGYCSFIVPLAESFKREALLVWSRRGLQSRTEIIRTMTPQKILHRPSCRYVIDDCSEAELHGAVNAFLDAVGGGRAVPGQDGGDCWERAVMCG